MPLWLTLLILSLQTKVDVFIDLACQKSAAAWPTLKRIVRDQRSRVDFVFHVLPLSDYPIGYFAAKVRRNPDCALEIN